MKHNKHILYEWATDQLDPDFRIAWAAAAQQLGIELSRWIRELETTQAQNYLYVDPASGVNQLVLEIFDPVIDQEYIYRSSHLRLINNGCEHQN
jgi:hypothetical protein